MKNRVNVLLKRGYMTAVTLTATYYQKQTPHDSPTQKIAYFMSFPKNDGGLIEELARSFSQENVLIFFTKNCAREAQTYQQAGFGTYPLDGLAILFSKSLKVLTSVDWILCDNYFPILSGLQLNASCRVIQLWHANGAIKKFGWEDPQTKQRSKVDQKRFEKVYQRFDYYLVGSDAMAQVFKRSYGAEESRMLPFGFHRVDELVSGKRSAEKGLHDQQVGPILYAPTYRDDNQIIIETLDALDESAKIQGLQIAYQLHPVTVASLPHDAQWSSLIPADQISESAAGLYEIVDYLITDYSSIVFDYSLAKPTGRIQFYWPDGDQYDEKTGIQEAVKRAYSDEAIITCPDLIASLTSQETIDVAELNQKWNQYNDGTAQHQLIEFIKTQT